jgi:hypothetical protein
MMDERDARRRSMRMADRRLRDSMRRAGFSHRSYGSSSAEQIGIIIGEAVSALRCTVAVVDDICVRLDELEKGQGTK